MNKRGKIVLSTDSYTFKKYKLIPKFISEFVFTMLTHEQTLKIALVKQEGCLKFGVYVKTKTEEN